MLLHGNTHLESAGDHQALRFILISRKKDRRKSSLFVGADRLERNSQSAAKALFINPFSVLKCITWISLPHPKHTRFRQKVAMISLITPMEGKIMM